MKNFLKKLYSPFLSERFWFVTIISALFTSALLTLIHLLFNVDVSFIAGLAGVVTSAYFLTLFKKD